MSKWLNDHLIISTLTAPRAFNISLAATRILSLASCNFWFGLIVYFFEKVRKEVKT